MEKGSSGDQSVDPTQVNQVLSGVGVQLDQAGTEKFIGEAHNRIASGSDTSIDRQIAEAHAADLAGQAPEAEAAPSQPSPAPAPVEAALLVPEQPAAEATPPEPAVETPEPQAAPVAPKEPVPERSLAERTIVDDALTPVKQRVAELEKMIAQSWGKDTTVLERELSNYKEYESFLENQGTIDSNGEVQNANNEGQPEENGEPQSLYADIPLLGKDGLVDQLAKARSLNDRTVEQDIKEVIDEKIRAQKDLNEDNIDNISDQVEALAARRQEELDKANQAEASAAESQPSPEPAPAPVEAAPVVPEQPAAEATPPTSEPEEVREPGDPETGSGGSEPESQLPEAESPSDVDPSAPEVEATAQTAFDAVLDRYVSAKYASEKTLSRKAQREELDAAGTALKEAFDQMLETGAETMQFSDETLNKAIEINKDYRNN
ncbi:MAG TPA: hypothetical protein VGF75_04580, partial [Candidatus Saccharimonadales bacterium]